MKREIKDGGLLTLSVSGPGHEHPDIYVLNYTFEAKGSKQFHAKLAKLKNELPAIQRTISAERARVMYPTTFIAESKETE